MRCDAMRWSAGGEEVLSVAASSKESRSRCWSSRGRQTSALDSSSGSGSRAAGDRRRERRRRRTRVTTTARKEGEGPRPAGGKLTLLLHVPNRNTFSELIIFLCIPSTSIRSTPRVPAPKASSASPSSCARVQSPSSLQVCRSQRASRASYLRTALFLLISLRPAPEPQRVSVHARELTATFIWRELHLPSTRCSSSPFCATA